MRPSGQPSKTKEADALETDSVPVSSPRPRFFPPVPVSSRRFFPSPFLPPPRPRFFPPFLPVAELGVDLRITKLRIKPGKPFVFGVKGNSFAFGLPGNPVSAYVCTMRLASRLLDRLAGGEIIERWQTARLEVGMVPNGPREFYQPVIRTVPPARNSAQSVLGSVRPLAWKGSADLFTLAAANALLVRGENEPALPLGTVVRVLEI